MVRLVNRGSYICCVLFCHIAALWCDVKHWDPFWVISAQATPILLLILFALVAWKRRSFPRKTPPKTVCVVFFALLLNLLCGVWKAGQPFDFFSNFTPHVFLFTLDFISSRASVRRKVLCGVICVLCHFVLWYLSDGDVQKLIFSYLANVAAHAPFEA